MAKVEFKDFKDLQKKLAKAKTTDANKLQMGIVNELVARGQQKVVNYTPVITGDLRRSWKALPAKMVGKKCVGSWENPLEYAPYVNNGHRTRGGKGFVKGQYMLEKMLAEVNKEKNAVITRHVEKFLRGLFNDK